MPPIGQIETQFTQTTRLNKSISIGHSHQAEKLGAGLPLWAGTDRSPRTACKQLGDPQGASIWQAFVPRLEAP